MIAMKNLTVCLTLILLLSGIYSCSKNEYEKEYEQITKENFGKIVTDLKKGYERYYKHVIKSMLDQKDKRMEEWEEKVKKTDPQLLKTLDEGLEKLEPYVIYEEDYRKAKEQLFKRKRYNIVKYGLEELKGSLVFDYTGWIELIFYDFKANGVGFKYDVHLGIIMGHASEDGWGSWEDWDYSLVILPCD